MPIYAFRCRSCGHRFEEFYRSMPAQMESAPPCPQCASGETVKLVSSFAVSSGASGVESAAESTVETPRPSVTPLEQISQWRKTK